MQAICRRAFSALVLTSFSILASAAGPTKADMTELAGKAVQLVQKQGATQAAVAFNSNPEWKPKGINTALFNFEGLSLANAANPRVVGKMMLEAKDPTGKLFIQEYISTAKSPKGEGWVYYQFLNPESKAVEDRMIFIRRVPGQDLLVGVASSKF